MQAGDSAGEIVEEVDWFIENSIQSDALLLRPQEIIEITGYLRSYNGGIPQGGLLKFTVSSEYSTHNIPEEYRSPLSLALGADGAFSQSFSFSEPGVYAVTLEVYDTLDENNRLRVQKRWLLRVDNFVQVQDLNLQLNLQNYRYFAVSIPDILIWLQSVDEDERVQRLKNLFAELKAISIDVIRVFIGRTQGEYPLRLPNGVLNEAQSSLLDFLVEQAGLNEIKLILVLADGRRETDNLDCFLAEAGFQNPSAEEQNILFTSAEAQSVFFNWISVVMSHVNPLTDIAFSEDPSILAWELFHLPKWDLPSPLSPSVLSDFLINAFEEMNINAPHQLLFSGEIGLDYNPTAYQSHAQVINSLMLSSLLDGSLGGAWSSTRLQVTTDMPSSNVVNGLSLEADSLMLNRLNQSVDWLNFGQAWLRGHALVNIPTQRPLIVHLSRIDRTTLGQSSLSIWRQWIQEAFSQGYAGITIGDFYLTSSGPDSNSWPLEDSNVDQQSILNMLNDLSERFRRP